MEEEIDAIVESRWEEMFLVGNRNQDKKTLRLAVLDGYRAGMEASRKVYTS